MVNQPGISVDNKIFMLPLNITSLEDERINVPLHCRTIWATNKTLTSLKGISRFPHIKKLWCDNNKLKTFEGLIGSNVEFIDADENQIASLKGLSGSNVLKLQCYNNPCWEEFKKYDFDLEKVYASEEYAIPEIKEVEYE